MSNSATHPKLLSSSGKGTETRLDALTDHYVSTLESILADIYSIKGLPGWMKPVVAPASHFYPECDGSADSRLELSEDVLDRIQTVFWKSHRMLQMTEDDFIPYENEETRRSAVRMMHRARSGLTNLLISVASRILQLERELGLRATEGLKGISLEHGSEWNLEEEDLAEDDPGGWLTLGHSSYQFVRRYSM